MTKPIRGAQQGIYALTWSPNSQYLLSGSFFDNTLTVWDASGTLTQKKFAKIQSGCEDLT